MRLILGGINGRYLREIVENAEDDTERVDAAVAYATDASLLFDWCLDKRIPLRFWGRFDSEVPVAIPVLKKFIQQSLPTFECRLVRMLHAKVIWWRGYGVYIGSANLTSRAWYNNIEAGVFLSESEIAETEYASELETLLRITHNHSVPLTRELLEVLERRDRQLQQARKNDKASADRLLGNAHVPIWDGLAMTTLRSALDAAKGSFLKEWNETLELMRGLALRISQQENRPSWVGERVPAGAQADQFLHAHYYKRTFEGQRAMFESMYERNKGNPMAATDEAVAWWRSLPAPPSHEDVTLNEWAVFLREHLSSDGLSAMTEDDFIGICSRVYAIRDHGRRVANRILSLPGDRAYTRDEKTQALARFLFVSKSQSGKSVADTLRFVLFGGSKSDLPERLWEATNNPDYRQEHLGINALGELVGWALPDHFPPRNGRTSKALRSLGYDVTVHA
jgi:hypothetical protein